MKRPLCVVALILTAAVLLYLELFYSDIMAESACAESEGSFTTIQGRVTGKELSKDYTGGDRTIIYVALMEQNPSDQNLSNSMSVQCYLDEEADSFVPSIGTFVRLSGRVKLFSPPTNPGEFDSRLYYTTLKIAYRLTGASVLAAGGKPDVFRESLWRLKTAFGNSLDEALSPEDAGIMKAMLLGDKSSMDEEIREQFKAAGIVHILAISGTHIAILGMGFYEVLRRILLQLSILIDGLKPGRRSGYNRAFHPDRILSGVLAVFVMYSYGVMCGMGSSAFRAILMFSLRILAPLIGRTYDILSALSLAEILLLLEQPLYLYNSGFLMSFGAVVGIVVIKPCLEVYSLKKGQKMRFADDKKSAGFSSLILEGLGSSVAIGIAALPVYTLFYYTFPLQSLFINLLVIPAMGVLLAFGAFCMMFGGISAVVTRLLAFGIHVILGAYKALSSFGTVTSRLTWYLGHSDKWQVAGYILLLIAFVYASERQGKRNVKAGEQSVGLPWKHYLGRFALLGAAIFLLTFRIPSGLSIYSIDVGQGDSILISSAGHNLLIDGGSTSKKNAGKYQIIPVLKYKGIGKLDGVVVTHEDEDHISGILEIMDDMEKGGIRINKLILPEVSESSRGENYRRLESRAEALGIPILYINSGESFSLGKASFTCLNPELGMITEGANEYSTVLYMKYKDFTALFTGDMEGAGLEYVKEQLTDSCPVGERGIDLLKVAHHGSRYTTDEEFLELTKPDIVIISCGRGNSYGHPHEELLERLNDIGAAVYRTDISGCISFTITNRYKIKTVSHLKK